MSNKNETIEITESFILFFRCVTDRGKKGKKSEVLFFLFLSFLLYLYCVFDTLLNDQVVKKERILEYGFWLR